MFLKIIMIPMLMIFSCSPAAKESSATGTEAVNQPILKILTATESVWFGGVQGVRGKNFTVTVKSLKAQKITFSALEVDGKKIPVNVSQKGRIYTVTARTTEPGAQPDFNPVPEKGTSSDGSNGGILIYTVGNSKTVKKLTVSKFTTVEKKVNSKEEPVQ